MPWKGERETGIAWFRALPVKMSRCRCKEEKASIGLVTGCGGREREEQRTTQALGLSNRRDGAVDSSGSPGGGQVLWGRS